MCELVADPNRVGMAHPTWVGFFGILFMNELFKKSFFGFVSSVVVRRWEELVLLAGLYGGLVFVLGELTERMKPGGGMSEGSAFFVMVVGVAFAVIVNMLIYGFLRSVAVVGCEPLAPVVLLKIGRQLFWRMFWVEMLLGLLLVLFFILFTPLIGSVLQIGEDDTLGWLRIEGISMFVSLMCLMKLRLVVGGMIFVRDCSVREAFGNLRQFRLGDGGRMLWVFGVSAAVMSLVSYLVQRASELGEDTLVFSVLYGVVIGASVVLWGLCSVWFVGRVTWRPESR